MDLLARVFLASGALALSSTAFAADRYPNYFTGGFTVGGATGLLTDWGTVAATKGIQAGFGRWDKAQRTGVQLTVGYEGIGRELEPIGSLFNGVGDAFQVMPVRAGIRRNLSPRPDYSQLNLFANAIAVVGVHQFRGDGEVLGQLGVLSVGGSAGAEYMYVRQKRTGASLTAEWVVQPTVQPINSGFMAQGLVGLGGPRIGFNFIAFLGAPQ